MKLTSKAPSIPPRGMHACSRKEQKYLARIANTMVAAGFGGFLLPLYLAAALFFFECGAGRESSEGGEEEKKIRQRKKHKGSG